MRHPSRITIALVAIELLLLLGLFTAGLISWQIGGLYAIGLLSVALLRILVGALLVAGALLLIALVGMAMVCAWSIAHRTPLPARFAVVMARFGSTVPPGIRGALHAMTSLQLSVQGKVTAVHQGNDLFDHLLTPQHASVSSDVESAEAQASSSTDEPPVSSQTEAGTTPPLADASDAPPPRETASSVQGNEQAWEHMAPSIGSLPPSIAAEPTAQPYTHGPASWFTDEEHQASGTMPQQQESGTRSWRKRPRLILGLMSLLVVAGGLVSFVATASPSAVILAVPPPSIGTLVFRSSGQLDPLGARGTSDLVILDVAHLPALPKGTADMAWLLATGTDDGVPPLLLGTLQVTGGTTHLSYSSPDHTNLLARYSRLLITEEEAGRAPARPSHDPARQVATGAIPNIPTPGDEKQYSLLSHLQHLLAADPTLQSIGLGGGLDIWLYRNTGKLLEYTTAARDGWPNQDQNATALLRRQVIRTLDELDGAAYVGQDVPAGTPFLVDPQAGRIGLLQIAPVQDPPGYLAHVDVHLQGLADAPGHTTAQHDLAMALDQVTNTVMADLERVRNDAVQLVRMDNNALHQGQALILLNDMVTHATTAYVGQPDPLTGLSAGGVSWIHARLQGLAVIAVTATTSHSRA